MVWFIGRSVVVIVLAFALGLVVGWLWWRRQRVDAARARKAELARLRAELMAARAAAGSETVGTSAPIVVDPATIDFDPAAPSLPPTTSPAPLTLVTVPDDPSPETLAAHATPVEQVGTEGHEPAAVPGTAADSEGEDEYDTAEIPTVDMTEPPGDDLERVEGIGPRIGAALREAGIRTFRQLADADTTTLQRALEQAGLRFAPSLPTWSRQAGFLAIGDEDGFRALTQQLVGGRDVSGAK